jgi:hypothetical protein
VCREKLSGRRFGLVLAAGMIVVFVMAMCAALLVTVASQGVLRNNMRAIFIVVPIQGTIMAILFYILTLPFVVLAWKGAVYRERLFGVVGFNGRD